MKDKIIYGPVNSKRLGRSLGINILSTNEKICSFNCIYCQYGITKRSFGSFIPVEKVEKALYDFFANPVRIDYLTLSGNGEPTLHPEFDKIVKKIKEIRDKYVPSIPIALLSNSSSINNLSFEVLKMIDIKIFKLDAGTEELFLEINRPIVNISLKEIVKGLKKVSKRLPITIQTIFISFGEKNNYEKEALKEYLLRIKEIKPAFIQVYSCDRPVAQNNVNLISDEKLRELEEVINKKTKILTRAYLNVPLEIRLGKK
ncbi:MAG: radical SAM protein [candidate division WOR-3 bacterium]|nr:radical SAM protein [candidate division WOR-3 bacterium]